MEEITFSDDILESLSDKVVFITGMHLLPLRSSNTPNKPGGASGIGRATAEQCLKLGATVVIGDLNPLPADLQPSEKLKYIQIDVCSWESQRDAFIQIEAWFGRLDHVFANAGLGPTTNFLDDQLDENGLLTPPDLRTINVNILGVISTVRLAAHYIQKHSDGRGSAELGSIVVTASTASLQTFSFGDYTISKHAVLGMIRGLASELEGKLRFNAVAPSWTSSKMVPVEFIQSLGIAVQGPEVVAKSVVHLFADQERHNEVIYSWDGKYLEINQAKGGLLHAVEERLPNAPNEEPVVWKIKAAVAAREIQR